MAILEEWKKDVDTLKKWIEEGNEKLNRSSSFLSSAVSFVLFLFFVIRRNGRFWFVKFSSCVRFRDYVVSTFFRTFTRYRRRGIVVIYLGSWIGEEGSIPTHGGSLGKWTNLRPGQPMPCEGNLVVSPRCWRDTNLEWCLQLRKWATY